MGSVTSCDVIGLCRFLASVRTTKHSSSPSGILAQANKLCAPLDAHTEGLELFDEQPFMGILRVDQCERERAQPFSEPPKFCVRDPGSADPEVDCFNFDARLYDQVGQADLPIE